MAHRRYSNEEDNILIKARKDGFSFKQISETWLPDRTAEALQMHFSYLWRKQSGFPTKTGWNEGTIHPPFIEHTTGKGFVRDESAPVLAWAGTTLVWVRWTREVTEYYETNCWRSVPDGEQVRVRYWISIPTPPDGAGMSRLAND